MSQERALLTTSSEISLTPDHNMFGIFDSADPLDQSAPMPAASEGGLVGAGSTSILVGSLQQSIAVAVRLEGWTGQPPDPSPGDHWEDRAEATIDLPTGKLRINLITMGWLDADGFSLAPGAYHVRIAAHGRRRVRDAYAELLDQISTDHVRAGGAVQAGLELARAQTELNGQEEYLVQFWPKDDLR